MNTQQAREDNRSDIRADRTRSSNLGSSAEGEALVPSAPHSVAPSCTRKDSQFHRNIESKLDSGRTIVILPTLRDLRMSCIRAHCRSNHYQSFLGNMVLSKNSDFQLLPVMHSTLTRYMANNSSDFGSWSPPTKKDWHALNPPREKDP